MSLTSNKRRSPHENTDDHHQLDQRRRFGGHASSSRDEREILTEKSGNLNLGVEGQMYMGAVTGLAAAWLTERWFGVGGIIPLIAAVVFAFLMGCISGLIYSVLTVTLRANQNVTGLTLAIFGTGFGQFFGEVLSNEAGGYVTVGAETKHVFATLISEA